MRLDRQLAAVCRGRSPVPARPALERLNGPLRRNARPGVHHDQRPTLARHQRGLDLIRRLACGAGRCLTG